jgi:hypothetical protein
VGCYGFAFDVSKCKYCSQIKVLNDCKPWHVLMDGLLRKHALLGMCSESLSCIMTEQLRHKGRVFQLVTLSCSCLGSSSFFQPKNHHSRTLPYDSQTMNHVFRVYDETHKRGQICVGRLLRQARAQVKSACAAEAQRWANSAGLQNGWGANLSDRLKVYSIWTCSVFEKEDRDEDNCTQDLDDLEDAEVRRIYDAFDGHQQHSGERVTSMFSILITISDTTGSTGTTSMAEEESTNGGAELAGDSGEVMEE